MGNSCMSCQKKQAPPKREHMVIVRRQQAVEEKEEPDSPDTPEDEEGDKELDQLMVKKRTRNSSNASEPRSA
jgi:hypothetical protein